jgi:predicted naringenin-chalcone synthase
VASFFHNSHIQTRYLALPEPGPDGRIPAETGTELLDRHLQTSLEIGGQAIERCLAARGVRPDQIDYFVVVTSTGFLCPSLTAHLIPRLGLRPNVHRADLAGMGCNGGMNGLIAATQFCEANPGRYALLLTCEVCSAAYVFELTKGAGVVNSLFGDGAAAALLAADESLTADDGPRLIDFESLLMPESIREMRFDLVDGKFSFFLGREVPHLIAAQVDRPLDALLTRNGLRRGDIRHWLVHSGGKKVIDGICARLALSEHDVRHTRVILRDFGNLSSAAFLFSYQRLAAEGVTRAGDWGAAIAMGPGLAIETGLLRW